MTPHKRQVQNVVPFRRKYTAKKLNLTVWMKMEWTTTLSFEVSNA